MQTLRQIKNRIRTIENTKKITRAMEMVSATKLNKIRSSFYAFHSYYAGLETILRHLIYDIQLPENKFTEKRDTVKKTALFIISSDAGLCGSYNHSIITCAEDFAGRYDRDDLRLIVLGKEALAHFRKKSFNITDSYTGLYGRYSKAISDELADKLIKMFLNKEVDEIYAAYTHLSTTLHHIPKVEKFLNIECDRKNGRDDGYILEPDPDSIIDYIIPQYLSCKITYMLLDSFTSEHSARMFAMKMATDNAQELIDSLTLLRNKARQTAITKEVLEIAMSAEALKG